MSEDLQNPTGPSPVQTAGALLRQAREATGLHIAALAVAMKVPVKKLDALEANRLDELHDAVFVRALAASMCRALKIDPAPVLSLLPQTVALKFERDDRGINMPYSTPGLLSGHALKGLFAKPAVWLVVALVLAALAVMWYPQASLSDHAVAAQATPQAVPAADASSPAGQPTAGADASPAAVVSSVAAPAIMPAPAASTSVATLAAPVALAASAVASAPPADTVVFKARASAWVRVTDSKGVVQFEKTLAAGDSAAAGGALPLSVVLGNVAATDVLVHGQPFGLEAVTKDNVARFEVK